MLNSVRKALVCKHYSLQNSLNPAEFAVSYHTDLRQSWINAGSSFVGSFADATEGIPE